jgi:hypothetical protein
VNTRTTVTLESKEVLDRQMSQKSVKSIKHPDDFMVVSVSLQFQAKHNPDVADPQPLDFTELENTFLAADAAEYLEKVLAAIRDRRLYGFATQEIAEVPIASGDWIAMTTDDLFAARREESDMESSPPAGGEG